MIALAHRGGDGVSEDTRVAETRVFFRLAQKSDSGAPSDARSDAHCRRLSAEP
jgi:hypothetical protein